MVQRKRRRKGNNILWYLLILVFMVTTTTVSYTHLDVYKRQGKTTTREMIAAVVRQRYTTLTTKDNLNNNIGMPQTLLELTPAHQAAVIEMGMTALGEIEELATTLLPQIGVITNIGVSHMERLGSQQNIRRAKLAIRCV